MQGHLVETCPMRQPRWRLDRVLQLLRHRPQPMRPVRIDDYFIRVYYLLLVGITATRNDDVARVKLLLARNDMYQAHNIFYAADIETRLILEARLLTTETFAEIAARLATTPKAVEYYEGVFFNVRDRLSNGDWIHKIIRGKYRPHSSRANEGLSMEQRGYLLKLCAYIGGPLALDAMINGMLPENMPQSGQEIGPWFGDLLSQMVRINGINSASGLPLSYRDIAQGLGLGKTARSGKSARGHAATGPTNEHDYEKILEAIEKSLHRVNPGTTNS